MGQAGLISITCISLAGFISGVLYCIGSVLYSTVSYAAYTRAVPAAEVFLRIVVTLLRYVTKFPCETFGWYVAMVYLQVSSRGRRRRQGIALIHSIALAVRYTSRHSPIPSDR